MIAFKDARLKVVTVKSFKDGDLPGIRSVFAWGVDSRKLTRNPADAIKVKAEKKKRTRSNIRRSERSVRYSGDTRSGWRLRHRLPDADGRARIGPIKNTACR
jgi:hypothetical protein